MAPRHIPHVNPLMQGLHLHVLYGSKEGGTNQPNNTRQIAADNQTNVLPTFTSRAAEWRGCHTYILAPILIEAF